MSRLNDFMYDIDLAGIREYISENGRTLSFASGEELCREGERCRYCGLVTSGYFKFTAINSKGDECVTGFAFEGEPVTDYVRSFLTGQPSFTSITAGCNSTIKCVTIDEARQLMNGATMIIPTLTTLLQEAYRRYLDLHVLTPAERYNELLQRCHEDINAIPLKDIASYLSISRRQLHRIRG